MNRHVLLIVCLVAVLGLSQAKPCKNKKKKCRAKGVPKCAVGKTREDICDILTCQIKKLKHCDDEKVFAALGPAATVDSLKAQKLMMCAEPGSSCNLQEFAKCAPQGEPSESQGPPSCEQIQCMTNTLGGCDDGQLAQMGMTKENLGMVQAMASGC